MTTSSTRLAPREVDDRRRIERVDAGDAADARLARDRVAAGGDDDLVHAGLGGQLPGERVLAPAAADDQDPGRGDRGSRRQAPAGGASGARPARSSASAPGPTDTRTIGTPACSSSALT